MDRDIYGPEIRELIRQSLIQTVPGEFSAHKDNPYYRTLTPYDMKTVIEGLPLYPREVPSILSSWAKLEALDWDPQDFLVLDLETTGLGRGGILAFMIGLGYYEGGQFFVEQIFLPEPDAEVNSFDRVAQLMQTRSTFITFNGKTFDIPVLESRLLYNQIWLNLREKQHIDLLHIARRLWKNKAPNCALETLEYYILGHIRDAELDIESGDIPQTYFQYLINGDPELMRRIFVHNQYDILHTAALFTLICDSIADPVKVGSDPRIDYHAVAKLYHSQGRTDSAKAILKELLAQETLTPLIVHDLGLIYKKEKNWAEAGHCFELGSELGHPESLLESAMILENRDKDYTAALELCEKLRSYLLGRINPDLKKLEAINKRIARIQHKQEQQISRQNKTGVEESTPVNR